MRRDAQMQRPPHTTAQSGRDALESFHRQRALFVAAVHAHKHVGLREIARHLHRGHGHETDDTRILHASREECSDLLADGFTNTIRTSRIPRHDEPLVRRRRGERARDRFLAIALEQVADLQVVEVLDADAALIAGLGLFYVVLEALERA